MSTNVPYDHNLRLYNCPETVSYYDALNHLTKCERFLFDAYLKSGMRILDIGVGGGRTIPYLTSITDQYVGIDYAENMIRLCKTKFPDLEFLVADASDMFTFSDGSFDAIVFSYNGMDYLYPQEKRLRCLLECFRLLKNQGIFIFSVHNAKSIIFRPDLEGLNWSRVACWLLYSIYQSIRFIIQKGTNLAFWRGDGYIVDPVHGGLLTHVSTPEHVTSELTRCEFNLVTIVGSDYPRRNLRYATPWYYYVFVKSEASA